MGVSVPTTTAIIGHGKSPEGKGWAPLIDACERVVRMWDWQWMGPDYGTRYDYGIIEVHPGTMRRFWEHNERTPAKGFVASYLWVPGPSPAKSEAARAREIAKARQRAPKLPVPTQVYNQRDWLDGEGACIGGVGETGRWELTRGAFAACWAIITSSPGDTVLLVGFDNLYAGYTLPMGDAFPAAYLADPASAKFSDYFDGQTKSGNHDFPAEHGLIEYLAERRGVRLQWAQDVWPGGESTYPPRPRSPWETTYIIGGGPSAKTVDPARMRGGVVLGVNDAGFHKPCDVWMTLDHNYALSVRGQIEQQREAHVIVRDKHRDLFRGWSSVVRVWRRVVERYPTRQPGCVSSGGENVPGCSGYAALNLAWQYGARRIVLFGFDFGDHYTYWFDDTPHKRRHTHTVRQSFVHVAPYYQRHGVEIINASPGSYIKAFPIVSHAEAYAIGGEAVPPVAGPSGLKNE